MPSDLQITNIRDLNNANSAISIASDGQVTIAQNNPTITLHATGDSSSTNTTFPQGHIIKSQTHNINLTGGTAIQSVNETDFNYDASNSTSTMVFTPIQEITNLIVTIQMCLRHGTNWQSHLFRCYYKIGSGSWTQFFLEGWNCFNSNTNVSNGMFMEARTSRRHNSGFNRGTDTVSIKWTHEGHSSGNFLVPNSYNIDASSVDLTSTQISQFGGLITISEEKV
tara:strand:- start:3393 stop:4064 length:672 start_codon:yes stop_codon:yes gene_type:complete